MLKGKSEESTSESPLISIFVSRIRDFRPKGQNLIRKKSKAPQYSILSCATVITVEKKRKNGARKAESAASQNF